MIHLLKTKYHRGEGVSFQMLSARIPVELLNPYKSPLPNVLTGAIK